MRSLKMISFVMAFVLGLQACGSAGEPTAELPSPTATVVSTPTATPYPPFEFTSIPLKAGLGFRASWIELYFTDPTNPSSAEGAGGLEGPLTAAIVAARETVDVAVNSLGVSTIADALVRVHSRGIQVRVVMETDNMVDRLNPQQLRDAGIPIVDDRRDGIMNNSFIVIDNQQVLTGSLNYTSSGLFRENNNLIRITSAEVAANYTKEFEEMFSNDQFGPSVAPETPNPRVTIQDYEVEVLFSPDDLVISRLVQLVEESQESIRFLTYSLNSEQLGSAIRDRGAEGVSVSGVMDSSQKKPDNSSAYELFREAGLDVRISNSSEVLNHKVLIIDGRIVVLGSYDYSNRAENVNDENVIIIHNELIAEKFIEEFERIQSRAQP